MVWPTASPSLAGYLDRALGVDARLFPTLLGLRLLNDPQASDSQRSRCRPAANAGGCVPCVRGLAFGQQDRCSSRRGAPDLDLAAPAVLQPLGRDVPLPLMAAMGLGDVSDVLEWQPATLPSLRPQLQGELPARSPQLEGAPPSGCRIAIPTASAA
jgi:hypothetical protein